jgi:hypothetical protein
MAVTLSVLTQCPICPLKWARYRWPHVTLIAVRVRPYNTKEKGVNGDREPPPVIQYHGDEPTMTVIPENRQFTYDCVFDPSTQQAQVYEEAVAPLVEKFIEGEGVLCAHNDAYRLQCDHFSVWPDVIRENVHDGHGESRECRATRDTRHRTLLSPPSYVDRFLALPRPYSITLQPTSRPTASSKCACPIWRFTMRI